LRNPQWASTLLQPLLRSCKERTHVCLAFSYCSSRLRFSPAASTLASRMACLERCCSRATSSPCFSRGMASTFLFVAYPEFITLIKFAIAHNCAPALTGIISRLRTRLHTPISSVAKYSLRVSIASKKIIKAQWSSVGTVFGRPKLMYGHTDTDISIYRYGNKA